MMRWVVVVSVLLACRAERTSSTVPSEMLDGKSATPAAPAAGSGSAAKPEPARPPAAGPAALSPEAACARFEVLAQAGCSWTQRFPPEFRAGDACVTSLRTWFSPTTAQHESLERTVGCWALDCDAAAACMVSAQVGAPPPAERRCGDEGTGPVLVDANTWAARRGAGVKRFSAVQTTEETPVEVCGIEGEVEWMTHVVCNDGSNPYRTPDVANESRDGWLARGGRCNSILDRYSVKCPEATYRIHVDRYICPRER
jgi:hypothetical protein